MSSGFPSPFPREQAEKRKEDEKNEADKRQSVPGSIGGGCERGPQATGKRSRFSSAGRGAGRGGVDEICHGVPPVRILVVIALQGKQQRNGIVRGCEFEDTSSTRTAEEHGLLQISWS